MDYNAYSAQQLHRQRSAELARATELRRRSAERGALRDEAHIAPRVVHDGAWRRLMVRWHLVPRIAH